MAFKKDILGPTIQKGTLVITTRRADRPRVSSETQASDKADAIKTAPVTVQKPAPKS